MPLPWILSKLRALDPLDNKQMQDFLNDLEKYHSEIATVLKQQGYSKVGADDMMPALEKELKPYLVATDAQKIKELDVAITDLHASLRDGISYYCFINLYVLAQVINEPEQDIAHLISLSYGLEKGIAHLETSIKELKNTKEIRIYTNTIKQLKNLKLEVGEMINQNQDLPKDCAKQKLNSFFKIIDETRQALPKKSIALKFLAEACLKVVKLFLGLIKFVTNHLQSDQPVSNDKPTKGYKGRHTLILNSVEKQIHKEVHIEMEEKIRPRSK